MKKTEFLELLNKYNIDSNLVVFDDSIKEGYCIRRNYFRWEVSFRERGKEYDCIGFPSESNALQYLFEKLYSIYVDRTVQSLTLTQGETNHGTQGDGSVCSVD